jgi:TRAF3-interacting protein 1
MVDGDDGMSDDDEEEVKGDAELDAKFAPIGSGGPKGRLVQDIEGEMKEDAQAAMKQKEEQDKKKDAGGIRLGRLKKSAKQKKGNYGFTESEITDLRKSIQVLCQATNPLGKCMDHVHDDMETMNKELEQWKSEYRRNVEVCGA